MGKNPIGWILPIYTRDHYSGTKFKKNKKY